jgi:DNA-binding GntR family transcriptional regulator
MSVVRALDRSTAIEWPAGGRGERPLSVAEQIAGAVMRQILEGDYQLGERIKEQDLAERFRVSRGPVRDALRILAGDGIVEILPNRGARVTRLTVEEVSEMFDIREALYGVCVRLIAARRTPSILTKLEEGIARLEAAEAADDTIAYTQASFELGVMTASSCGNSRLADILLSLARQTSRYTQLGLQTAKRRRRSLNIWKQLYRAVAKGDADTAAAKVQTLVAESRTAAIDALRREQAHI